MRPGSPVFDRVFVEPSHEAFRSGDLVIRETVYGVAKRLRFLLESIEGYRARHCLAESEVRILDVGCGTGVNITVPLAQAGYRVVGLDWHVPSLRQGRTLADPQRNLGFVSGDLQSLPFREPFHVAICSEVLEHVEDTAGILQALRQAVVPGGLLLITLPNPFGFFEVDSVVWRWISERPALVQRLYSWESRVVERCGSPALKARRLLEYEPSRLARTWSTLAPHQAHEHALSPTALTHTRLLGQLRRAAWRIEQTRNNTFLAGNLVGFVLRELDGALALNARAADVLPPVLASDWMVAGVRSSE